jgi:hypothetical protein
MSRWPTRASTFRHGITPFASHVTSWIRPRLPFIALAVGTIVLGLLVHLVGKGLLHPVARDVIGDALYAVMIYWWVGAAAPQASLQQRGFIALAVCVAVELSQLYRAPAIDALRATLPGHLVLGSSFDWRDLGVYTIGALAAVLIERGFRRAFWNGP